MLSCSTEGVVDPGLRSTAAQKFNTTAVELHPLDANEPGELVAVRCPPVVAGIGPFVWQGRIWFTANGQLRRTWERGSRAAFGAILPERYVYLNGTDGSRARAREIAVTCIGRLPLTGIFFFQDEQAIGFELLRDGSDGGSGGGDEEPCDDQRLDSDDVYDPFDGCPSGDGSGDGDGGSDGSDPPSCKLEYIEVYVDYGDGAGWRLVWAGEIEICG